jgi:hypothetical protein
MVWYNNKPLKCYKIFVSLQFSNILTATNNNYYLFIYYVLKYCSFSLKVGLYFYKLAPPI